MYPIITVAAHDLCAVYSLCSQSFPLNKHGRALPGGVGEGGRRIASTQTANNRWRAALHATPAAYCRGCKRLFRTLHTPEQQTPLRTAGGAPAPSRAYRAPCLTWNLARAALSNATLPHARPPTLRNNGAARRYALSRQRRIFRHFAPRTTLPSRRALTPWRNATIPTIQTTNATRPQHWLLATRTLAYDGDISKIKEGRHAPHRDAVSSMRLNTLPTPPLDKRHSSRSCDTRFCRTFTLR